MAQLLKFMTCGSVDDGKSTLIGRMLYDSKLLFTDQRRALEMESRLKNQDGALDYSLLLDGLMAEREQRITIDVAYRYFTTEKRSFIVADAPGHDEYTRNMAVAASFADAAVILVDAAKGILTQTRRHARICALMGIRCFCFAVNKMDLIQYRQDEFDRLAREIRKLAVDLNLSGPCIIPVSATQGDNVSTRSARMPWYTGCTLLEYLETLDIQGEPEPGFVLPVQRVCRPDSSFRGFEGQIEAGEIAVGDPITVLPSGECCRVAGLLSAGEPAERAGRGEPVTLCLDRNVDVSRGCVLTKDRAFTVGTLFTAELLWLEETPLYPGRSYLLRLGTQTVPATVLRIKHKTDINSGERIAVTRLFQNELALCDLSAVQPLVFDSFDRCRALGGFLLIDRVSNRTCACGVIRHPLRRSDNLTWQKTDVTRALRSAHTGQTPLTLWFTGLSGSGKSTIANALERRLFESGRFTMLLDGDNVRMGLNRNLGFEPEDRIENIRRIAEVAKMMNDAGLIVLTAFISPYADDRQNARRIVGEQSFFEIYVSTPLSVCERRDVKGLYRRARNGEIPNFTGISSPYEVPGHPDVTVSTAEDSVEACVDRILAVLEHRLSKGESVNE